MSQIPRDYAPPRHPAPIELRLAANEGPAPAAFLLDALRSAGPELLRRYPDRSALEAVLAARLDVAPARLLVTAGADEGLDRLFRAVLGPGRSLVLPEPTFEMLPRYARLCGARIISIDWQQGPYPLDAVLAACDARTAVVAVVSPNNPTGAVVTPDELQRLAAAVPQAVVLVDAAYAEYADDDLTATALALPNAVVFRTLSKAWGLAGLRLGYASGPLQLIDALRAAGSPYAVAAPSLAIAAAALAAGDAALRTHVARIREERAVLVERAAEWPVRAAPSQGNFVLLRTADARWLRDGIAGLGIGVRIFDQPALRDAVRVTCPGEPIAFERLLAGIDAVLRPQALLLDMDGVLADVSASYRAAIVATALTFGVTVSADDVRRVKARGNANDDWQLTQTLLSEAGHDVALETVRNRFEDIYQGTAAAPGLYHNERLLPRRELLTALAAQLPLGIVTGRPRRDAERFLAMHDLTGLFAAVICREDAPLKPSPEPVQRALAALGCTRAWLVGDTVDDLRAARAAGVVPIGCRAPGDADDAPLLLAGAARVLTDLEPLPEMLR